MRLGILSNWDARLLSCLECLGIRRYFDPLVVSHEVGVEKPHPAIFAEAARRAGAPPVDLVMVGDSLELDVLPSLELGWKAVWISRESLPSSPAGAARLTGAGSFLRVASFRDVLPALRSWGVGGSPPGG